MVTKQASRRIRPLAMDTDESNPALVYVGPNPVILEDNQRTKKPATKAIEEEERKEKRPKVCLKNNVEAENPKKTQEKQSNRLQ